MHNIVEKSWGMCIRLGASIRLNTVPDLGFNYVVPVKV